MKRITTLLIITALLLGGVPARRGWASWTTECADYDLTGRMFAASYRTALEGVVKCVYEGRIEAQCPPVAPDRTVLVKEKPRKGDSVSCFYAPTGAAN